MPRYLIALGQPKAQMPYLRRSGERKTRYLRDVGGAGAGLDDDGATSALRRLVYASNDVVLVVQDVLKGLFRCPPLFSALENWAGLPPGPDSSTAPARLRAPQGCSVRYPVQALR